MPSLIFRLLVVFWVLCTSTLAFAAAPTATTSAATSLTPSSADLNGTGTPNSEATTGWFRIGTTDPVTCNDTFGTRVPNMGGTNLGSGGTAVAYSINTGGLTSGVTYYFCAIVSNASGTAFGSVLSFTVPGAPIVSTNAATLVTTSAATLNGAANPNSASTSAWFRYSTTNPVTCNNTFGTLTSSVGLGSGNSNANYSQNLSSLLPGTTYYYCAIANNTHGTSFGSVVSFTTAPTAPSVTTSAASSVTGSGAQLNGSANPGGAATTGWFRYATSNPGTCNDSFGTRAPSMGGASLGAGTSSTPFNQSISGLLPGTTYFYCAIAQNSVSTSFGTVVQFTTPNAPTVTTSAASFLSNTTAQLNGTANPNGSATTGWFRYATSDPGTCNDTFGSRAPVTGASSLGSGNSNVAYAQGISGLSPATTYYYCAIAQSAEGISFGSIVTFTTHSVPSVTTQAVSSLTASSAQLNASVIPNGASTSGWFRYSATNPGACNNSFGTLTSTQSLGSGTSPVVYGRGITGLTPATTYYFCAIASNTYGTVFGAVLSFTTPAAVPTVTTSSASGLTGTTAQLNGSANPGGAATTAWFRYSTASPGTCNDSFGTRAPAMGGSSLGSGTSSVAFLQSATGLTPGTTYYYCAIAQNSVGTSFGSVVQFTTPQPPSVTTAAATSISNTSATLNGSATPNGAATTGWFRYSTTDPGTCNDTFGSRAPTTGGSNLGSGSSPVAFAVGLSSLSQGTTYYYCAIAQSAEGTAFGAVLSFTTFAPPTVVTQMATSITATSATLNGTVNPNGSSASGWFRYATTNPGTCNNTFGTATSSSSLGSGTSAAAYSRPTGSLTPGTTYFYCAISNNSYGTSFGSVLSFTTQAAAPSATTNSASSVTGGGATLNGTANPNGASTSAWFRYSTTSPGTCNDAFGTRAPAMGGSNLGAGTSSTPFNQAITGLMSGTTYFYCAIAQNSVGTSVGTVVQFTTPQAPSVTTSAATFIGNTTAQLNGSANPNASATTGYFRYATSDPGTCNDTFGSRAPVTGGSSLGSGTSAVVYAQGVSGLSPGTTYYFCAIAQSAEGTSFGTVLTFTTHNIPSVTTVAQTSLTSNSAQLNGSVVPNGSSTTGWFRYSTANPGSCSNTFGTLTSSQGLGAGTTGVPYGQPISGLTPGTTYYYCAIASNTYGIGFGSVLSFTTPAAPPSVTTSAPSNLSGTGSQLNGSANPGGAATTGWFRYATASPGTCNDTFGTRAPAMGGTALGSGTTSVSFFQVVSGLMPGTTYYYCAIAQNSVATGFGSVVQFTTPQAPTVTTAAASFISNTTVQVNGSGVPNGASTTGWFRYSTSDPGTCDDTFGSRAPATGGSSLGSGTSSVVFSQGLSGLSPGTTYYVCAIAQSTEGIAFGNVLTFTTFAPPTVVTQAASAITATTATLNGTSNPNGSSASGWFRYATTNPGTCNNTFGTATSSSSLGSGTSAAAYSRPTGSLTPGTTYYFCAVSSNSYGTSFGSVLSFTTQAAAPSVTTSSATNLSGTGARLNGSANPGGASTTGWFRYATTSPGTCNDTFGTRAPAMGGTVLGAGTTSASFFEVVSGLSPGTTYFYCAIAQNSVGTSFGAIVQFTTPQAPSVTTSAATFLTNTTAQLNASGTPNGATTTGWFRYAATDPGTCNDTFGSRAPVTGGSNLGAGSSPVVYAASVSGLSPGTTYYFCAIVSSTEGTAFGAVMTFTTHAVPSVTTSPATLVTSNSVQLNGSVVPNGASSTGWFRYATTNPGICNNTFGTLTTSQSLGSGTSAVTYARAISGLLPGTTYYYCAIASNAYGTSVGMVQSFSTPAAAPIVTTNSATNLTPSTAQLNGSANPGGAATTGWFRYSTVSPGTCNDSFGTRVPAMGGTALGSGTSNQTYSQPISGLSAGTTYYYCAIAQNSVGLAVGSVVTFTAPAPPTVLTLAATPITATTATLNGTAIPNGFSTTAWFRYSSTNPGTCNDSFGTRAPTTGGAALGSGTSSVPFSQAVTGLLPATTYYFCAIGSSSIGTTFGEVLSFTTPAAMPTVTTLAATGITTSSAVLNATATPNGAATTGWFRYSTTNPGTCNDSFGTRTPATGGTDLGSGNSPQPFTASLTSLTTGQTYYFCAIASNGTGTSFGIVLSFVPSPAPSVTTQAATLVTSTSATLNGSANPNSAASTGWFRYSTVDPGTCNDSFGTRAPGTGGSSLGAGASPVAFNQPLTGLTTGTTYYYCAIAQSSGGLGFGGVVSFTTQAAPTVTTNAATSVTSTGATLNGSANPNLATATGWFRYATVNPGTCNDTFGTRVPATGGTALGAGSMPVSYSNPVTGLATGVTYYYCAIASNSIGTRFGTVVSFTTLAAPTVTTNAASGVSSTGATLNGSANPNLADATGWFRYATANPGTCNDTFGTPTASTMLGAGATPVAYTQPLTGLSSGTTYYYCAIASNAAGTRFGSVVSFTTTATPSVTTTAASAVASASATLNGSANPNGTASTGHFRYSTSNPGSCNDSFGTRAPATGGSSLGSGTSSVAYSEAITGLSPATTYYFCAIATSSVGTGVGTVMSFTTTAAPSVTTDAATSVSGTGATLNGTANPNLLATTGWFRYSTSDPGTCNDTFGTRAPGTGGSNLGSGSTPSSYSQAVTGLLPSTTYYFCAIAQNSVGTSFGSVLSFTTMSPATVTTEPASAVASTGATLNGSANPNGSATTGYFRYSTTSPGSCNDTFGTRAPGTGGSNLGSGSSTVSFSQAVTGLVPATTYYFCAVATSSVATTFGNVLSFTTTAAPSVTTEPATAVGATDATLNATSNPNLLASTGWFRYSTTSPGSCNDTFGTRMPATGGLALGSGSASVAFAQALTGLTPGDTYYFCAIAQNSVGTSFGAVLSFTTTPLPAVTTVAATAVSATAATLNGSANPNGSATTGWFRYDTIDPGTCDDSFGTRLPTTSGTTLGAGTNLVPFSESLSGLAPSTTYYYCAIAQSTAGTGFGAVMSFTTLGGPGVTTLAATSVAGTSATLNGSADPNGSATTGYFRYDTTDPGACNDTFGTRAPATGGSALGSGSTAVSYTQALTGLLSNTTYYFCAVATSTAGTGFGAVMAFTTSEGPAVTTDAATAITTTAATLNGSANPNGSATTGWFRYATTNPVACNDTFGTRVPVTGGTSLGAGSSPVAYTQALTGLVAGTTYYYCAIAQNSGGTGFGAVLSFTTIATPDVTTEAATSVGAMLATLNGSANPSGAATTGWFRYSTTDPGTCDDTFGTRAPATGGTAVGSGATAAAYSFALVGLTPQTTYYFCAVASNSVGTGFGEVLSFTTIATPEAPVVTTEDATGVTDTEATLNGTADPNGAQTSGWFRYDTTDPGDCDDTFGTRVPATGGTSVGAGMTAVDFSQDLTGLDPDTTYYFCAIAENEGGTSFGEVLTLTTSTGLPPTVTTEPATGVTNDEAVLNGSANPNGDETTAWFRYDTTDPGACNNTFGTRAPASGSMMLGAGTRAVDYSEMLSGLTAGTTYYYCAIAENANGRAFGEIQTFVPSAEPPSVTTEPATEVLGISATLQGTANPNGSDTIGWFRYGDFEPSVCDDAFGTRLPLMDGTMLADGDMALPFAQPLTDLEPNFTYFYCAAASNLGGAAFGEVLSFTTTPVPPVVTTEPAMVDIATDVVVLSGTADPRGSEATAWFRYDLVDPGTCNDTFGTRAPLEMGAALGAGRMPAPFSETVGPLPAGIYFACAIASNEAGTAFGPVVSFTVSAGSPDGGGGATPDEGCGCRVGSRASGSPVPLLVGLLVALLAFRRRRSLV